jgi:hypothetical protein
MSLADLRLVKHPARGPKVCVACKAFVAECNAPVGEGSAPMCWLCAHHVVDHNVPLHEAAEARCECTPEQIYPVRVLKGRAIQLQNAELRSFVPMHKVLEDDYMSRVKDTGPCGDASDRRDRLKKC